MSDSDRILRRRTRRPSRIGAPSRPTRVTTNGSRTTSPRTSSPRRWSWAPPSSRCAARCGCRAGRRRSSRCARTARRSGSPSSPARVAGRRRSDADGRAPRHAARHPALSPAWPERAAWGTAPSLRAWQTAALAKYLDASPRDFLAVATPGRRQDDVRADRRRRPAGPPGRRPDHDRRADRAPQGAVGRGGRPGRHPDRPGVRRRQGQDLQGLRRHRGHLRRRRGQPAGASGSAPSASRPW